MQSARWIVPALAGFAALALACDQVPTASDVSTETATLDHHRPGHGGGGGGGSGGGSGDPQVTLTVTGAIVVGPELATLSEDNPRRITIEMAGADLLLPNTSAAAWDEITNPSNPICEFRPADMPLATKQYLAGAFVGARTGGSIRVYKKDGYGTIPYNNTASGGPWLSLGFNTQTDEFAGATVDYQGTDPQDATSTRRFAFSGGIWRTLVNGSTDLVCQNQDAWLVVIEPLP
jgi:hypothetical protein